MAYMVDHPVVAEMAANSYRRSHSIPPEVPELDLLRLTLNQVDYGLVVLNMDTSQVQFANAPGWAALDVSAGDQGHHRNRAGLCLVHGRLAAVRPGHAEALRAALARTRSGLRGLLRLEGGPPTSSVAILPLPQASGTDPSPGPGRTAPPSVSYALLVFPKRQLCDDSTMALFARGCGLTNAEGQVLAQVCRGLRPAQIADHQGVQVSTVRTQLRSIRMKTCSDTIRELVEKVSVLPPMARHLATGPA